MNETPEQADRSWANRSRPTFDNPNPSFLVYRECSCGRWTATGENAPHPHCNRCDTPYLPIGINDPDYRIEHGLGMVAVLHNEQTAMRIVQAANGDRSTNTQPYIIQR